jgi:hypothetical protein
MANHLVMAESAEPRWLLLIHQIPPKPDYLRVKIRRLHDRIATAWLIRRFIDPEARFKFVPARGSFARRGR